MSFKVNVWNICLKLYFNLYSYLLKDICLNAVNVFDKIELIRSISNNLKVNGINEEAKFELKNLCIELYASFNLIHEKKNLAVIRKRLNKRRRHKVASQSLFYQNELANLLQEKCLGLNNSVSQTEQINSQTTRNAKVFKSIDNSFKNPLIYFLIQSEELQILHTKLKEANKCLVELKELADSVNLLFYYVRICRWHSL